ncbi:hypothetical protein O3M35_000314 [Rhynocoris fuscipes]|uniref:Ammonium transporter AmtB-like domain-containing protein n=1 Tax=Rhynocoris fuscipes TaxID=488301 RepID=A0AAW1DLZ8_9HEMI
MMTLGKRTAIIIIIFEIVMIIAFGFFASYGEEADSRSLHSVYKSTSIYYPMFQDIQVMTLIGFGCLMMFMKRYGYSGVAIVFFVSGITFQYGLLLQRILKPLDIGVKNLIDADITTVTMLISVGAVLGKTSLLQVFFMILIEVPIYIGNMYLSSSYLKASDIGGSVSVHLFGAYFGLAVSRVLGKPKNMSLEKSSYNSDLMAIVGTLFLWIFWPSFNGALSWEDGQQRAAHLQNASLSGGVAIGTAADFMLMPFAALAIGGVAGAITTLGFAYIQPWLLRKLRLHDTCGIHNLHGLPGILAGLVGVIASAQASVDTYGSRLYLVFPARAPAEGTELDRIRLQLSNIEPGDHRTAGKQAIYQLIALAVTFILSIVTGVITGIILKIITPLIGGVSDEYTHDDSLMWTLPEDSADDNNKKKEVDNIHAQHHHITGVI